LFSQDLISGWTDEVSVIFSQLGTVLWVSFSGYWLDIMRGIQQCKITLWFIPRSYFRWKHQN